QYKLALNTARSSHISSNINKANKRPKMLFSTINQLTHAPKHSLSDSESMVMCCSFLNHFQGKLDTLYATFGEEPTTDVHMKSQSNISMTTLAFTNSSLITELIQKSNSSSCTLDPAPTFLLKDCTSTISAPISHLINISFISSTVPVSLKTAAITPILKKTNLDPAYVPHMNHSMRQPRKPKAFKDVVFAFLSSSFS
ncbi:hypothetical protein C0J45_2281, partial [Silurus meridionalis]